MRQGFVVLSTSQRGREIDSAELFASKGEAEAHAAWLWGRMFNANGDFIGDPEADVMVIPASEWDGGIDNE